MGWTSLRSVSPIVWIAEPLMNLWSSSLSVFSMMTLSNALYCFFGLALLANLTIVAQASETS